MSENTVYQTLKKQIILLDYAPGAVIREKELMETFGVSRTPIREALMRLEMDGLVRIIPHIGTFVEDVSFQQLKDVFEVRSSLVRLAGQLAAERITGNEIDLLRSRLEAIKTTKDQRALMQLDLEVHRIINQACKNDILVKILDRLHDQAVRIWTFSGTGNSYWSELVKEFEEITAALERHDTEATAALLEKHTKCFVDTIRSQLAF